jgi:hypothetical protein
MSWERGAQSERRGDQGQVVGVAIGMPIGLRWWCLAIGVKRSESSDRGRLCLGLA